MKFYKNYIYSLVAPLMIVLSLTGFFYRKNNQQIYYLPMGLIGVFIILEKEMVRRFKRKSILDKIKSYQKTK